MKASNDVEELIKQLSEIAELRKRIRMSRVFLSHDINDVAKLYCKRNINPESPVKPQKLPEKKPTKVNEKNKKIIGLVFILTFGIIITIAIYLRILKNGNGDGSFLACVLSVILTIIGILFQGNAILNEKNRIKSLKRAYEKELTNYNKSVNYNKNEYPRLMEQYEKELSRYEEEVKNNDSDYAIRRKEFEDKYYNLYLPRARKTLEESERALSQYDGLISDKFIPQINSLIEILEDGRADSLKEAINVLISDQHNEQMLEEAREKNRILEQQRLDAEERARQQEAEDRRYREQMLEAQRRQAEAAERQERDERRKIEQANQEARWKERRFNDAQASYNNALWRASVASDESSKARAEREAAEAYGEMQKYK